MARERTRAGCDAVGECSGCGEEVGLNHLCEPMAEGPLPGLGVVAHEGTSGGGVVQPDAVGTEPLSAGLAALVAKQNRLRIRVVPNEYGACPRCGAYWGHPDKALDFPNRSKVGDEDGTWHWKCYNPACSCGYYDPERGTVTAEQATPEEEAESRRKAKEYVDELMRGKKWKTVEVAPGVLHSELVPDDE